MNNNSITNSKLEILAGLSETLNARLEVERYGLVLEHLSGRVRWMEMDGQTCALIVDFRPQTDIPIRLQGRASESFFHSLFLQKGDVTFSDFTKEGNLQIMPYESLYFHSDRLSPTIRIKKGKECRLILISHSVNGRVDPFTVMANGNNLELGPCDDGSCKLLDNVFRTGLRSRPFIEMKGLLFLLLSSTMPGHYRDISNNVLSVGPPRTGRKPGITIKRGTKVGRGKGGPDLHERIILAPRSDYIAPNELAGNVAIPKGFRISNGFHQRPLGPYRNFPVLRNPVTLKCRFCSVSLRCPAECSTGRKFPFGNIPLNRTG